MNQDLELPTPLASDGEYMKLLPELLPIRAAEWGLRNDESDFWEEANGEGITLDPSTLFFRFCTNHTAIATKLSTTNPTTIPIATAPPVLIPLAVGVAFVFESVAIGFSIGKEGKGEMVGVSVADELIGGEGEDDEGTEGGGDSNVDLGGEFVEGGEAG